MSTIDSFSLSSHNGSTSAASHTGIEDFGQYSVNDIIKVGYMKKLKTNKRKYFVLRLNNYPGDDSASIGGFAGGGGIGCGGVDHATLSYYDNEKKFRANLSSSGQTPRRTILVRECFAFDRKIDAKHRFVLAIYTKEDCLCTIVDDQQQLTEWLEALRNILHHSIDYLQRRRQDFEHIWQVNISRTVGLTRSLTGLHRICLSGNVLHVIRVDPSTYDFEVNEFPLNSIRRCGHSQSTFFLELGRSSSIGPGEVWMQTDDQSLAQNMHEVILSAMTAGSTTGADEESGISSSHRTSSLSYRPRSSSASVNESKSSLNSSSFQQSGRNSANIRHNSFKHSTHSNGLVQYEGATGTGTGHTAGFVHYGAPGQCYHHHHGHHPCVGRNSSAATIASNGSSQPSPSNSREHLHHSGSWSRTASECSNEDLMGSQGAFSSVSGNAGVLASGGPTINYFDCVANMPGGHLWSSPNLNCCCYSSSTFANSNCSVDFSNGNSTSSLSADCDSDLAQMNSLEYHSMHDRTATGCLLTTGHEPPISEEADGAGSDDYFPMNPTSIAAAAAAAASVKHHSQQSTASSQLHCGGGGQHSMMSHHRHYHRSVSTTSPITSPKYNGQCCCNCQLHFNGNKPGMMITDDYLPMSPVGNSALLTNGTSSGAILCSPNSHENGNTSKQSVATTNDDEEDSGYLVMAPLSPASSSTSKNLSESINKSGNLVLCTSPSDGFVLHNEPQVAVNPALVPTSSAPDDSIFSGLTRAYSTGSKPQPLAPSLGAQCIISVPSVTNQLPTPTTVISSMMTTNDTGTNSSMSGGLNLRIRAFSTGSHGMLNPNVIRMNSRRLKKHLLQQQQQQQIQHNHNNTLATSFDGGDTILSSNSSLTEESAAEMLKSTCLLSAKNSKASSAPILSPLVQQRARSATIGARPSMAGNTGGTVAGLTQTAPVVTTASAATSGIGIGHWQPQFYHQGGSTANKQQQQQHSHLIYSNSAGSKPPPLNENDDDDEGDLMEIDYSDKAKHRSKSNILNDEDDDDNCDVILSNFEEQLLREAKKLNQTQRRRSRQNHAGGASSSDSVIAALQAAAAAANASNQPLMPGPAIPNYYSDSPTGRKRSDSTSAVGTFFGPSRPTHHHHHHYHPNMHAHLPHHQLLSQSQSQQHSVNSHLVNQHHLHHQPRHNTLDSFVASFKNTLSLNQSLDSTSTTATTTTTNVTSTTATPTTQDEDQQQQPANINTPNKDSKSCTALTGNANRPIHPRKSANLKQQHLTYAKPDPVDCEPPDADVYTMMAPLSVTLASNSKNSNSKSPDSVSSSTTTSDLQVKMALAMKKVDLKSNVDDEDASPYVVMCPVDSGGTSRKSHSNNTSTSSTSSKKSMKSVRSLLFGPSSASSAQSSLSSAAAAPNNNPSNQNSATRKKSSTFSGKLRIGSRNGSNSSEKRKTTKSESSSTDQQTTPVAPAGSNISPTPTTTIGTVFTTTTTTTPTITSPSLA